jgi:hypothetical protein
MLRDDIAAILMGYVVPVNSAWFQEDGARPTPAVLYLAFFMMHSRTSFV